MGYVIMTDSSCDLPAKLVQKLGIEMVSLSLVYEDEAHEETEFSSEEFYRLLREGKTLSTTGVNVAQFQAAMTPILQTGNDILYLGFASKLSMTYKSAVLATKELAPQFPNQKILTVDTCSGSLGQGLLILMAAEAKAKGSAMEEVAELIQTRTSQVCHWFMASNLNYLRRGGRISTTSALLGSVLHIKPLLWLDQNAKVQLAEKVKGRKAALRMLVKTMVDHIRTPETQTVCIGHADCPKEAETLAQMVRTAVSVKDILINNVGPVVGTHVGPDALGLFFLGKR